MSFEWEEADEEEASDEEEDVEDVDCCSFRFFELLFVGLAESKLSSDMLQGAMLYSLQARHFGVRPALRFVVTSSHLAPLFLQLTHCRMY